jgi:tetratricopeptide (TPR) repeat protein
MNIYESLGFLAIKKGDFQEAINIFKRALESNQTLKSHVGLGITYLSLGEPQKAKWFLNRALQFEPENKEVLSYLKEIESGIDNKKSFKNPQSFFRVGKDYLEFYEDERWNKIFISGVNIGLGIPGYFPGEYAIERATYLKWFKQIYEMGANAVRIFTLHPPSFYEALYEFNQSGAILYLIQGIWYELPEDYNFSGSTFLSNLHSDIKKTIDAIYGNITLSEKPGYPSGNYRFDISSYTIAFILSREPESCAVKKYNSIDKNKIANFDGDFLEIKNATPFEIWITKICDFIQSYEYEIYKKTHPVSFVNWPTLDPISHWSESRYEDELKMQGIEVDLTRCVENEDEESLDPSKINFKKGAGFFATYNIYPYYPDFMVNDYLDHEDPYRTYLIELKKHHQDMPVLIAEFGIPSSRDTAHWHSKGWHQGRHNEFEQGKIIEVLLNDIVESKMAGAIIFSWFDEWYKKNWVFQPFYIPEERKAFWFNFQDPENNYGLIASYPGYPDKNVSLSANRSEWQKASLLYQKKDGPLYLFKDNFDNSRTLKNLAVQHDEGFLYIMLETLEKIDFKKGCYMIGIDTCNPEEGEFSLPFNTNVQSPIGLKFLLHFCGKEKSRILVTKSYDKYLNSEINFIRPTKSYNAEWVPMFIKTNNRRISKDGKRYFSSRVFSTSNLRFGSLDIKSPYRNSLADFFVKDNILEVRIPWALIGFCDPSSRQVFWKDETGISKTSDGVRLIALSYKPLEGSTYAEKTGLISNLTDSLPGELSINSIKTYSWDEWGEPLFHFYLKESYYLYKKALAEIKLHF